MGLSNRLALKTEPKEEIYFRVMNRLIETKGPIDGSDRDALKQFCFAGVKYTVISRRCDKGSYSVKAMEAKFTLMDIIMEYIAMLTPKELMILFPITKNYDGHKYQSKDYFTTKEDIKRYPLNEPIGRENIFGLIWDYWNWDLNFFLVEYMSAMSDLRRFQGEMGIMEEFCEKEGIETFSYHEKEGYIQSNKTGKATKVTKPKKRVPKQFRIVK